MDTKEIDAQGLKPIRADLASIEAIQGTPSLIETGAHLQTEGVGVLFKSGPLTSNGICAGGFARSDPRLERPDIQLNFSVWSFAERTKSGVVPHPFPGFTISAVHLRPDARGIA